MFTDRSVVHLDSDQAARKVQHWRSIAIAACEQSGRNRVPEIELPIGLYDLLERPTVALRTASTTGPDTVGIAGQGTGPPADKPMGLLLSPVAAQRLADIPVGGAGATVLIGPEGGLADVEQEVAVKAGYAPVRLGPRVLRTETAAVCALTLLQQKFGDM